MGENRAIGNKDIHGRNSCAISCCILLDLGKPTAFKSRNSEHILPFRESRSPLDKTLRLVYLVIVFLALIVFTMNILVYSCVSLNTEMHYINKN